MYASFPGISGALHLDVFDQPAKQALTDNGQHAAGYKYLDVANRDTL